MEFEKILIYVTMLIIVCVGILLASHSSDNNKAYEQACSDLGMKEAHYSETIFQPSYCIDKNNLAHKVIFECVGLWNTKCKAVLVVTNEVTP